MLKISKIFGKILDSETTKFEGNVSYVRQVLCIFNLYILCIFYKYFNNKMVRLTRINLLDNYIKHMTHLFILFFNWIIQWFWQRDYYGRLFNFWINTSLYLAQYSLVFSFYTIMVRKFYTTVRINKERNTGGVF